MKLKIHIVMFNIYKSIKTVEAVADFAKYLYNERKETPAYVNVSE